MSAYLHSEKLAQFAKPLFLLTDTCTTEVPELLAKEFRINLISFAGLITLCNENSLPELIPDRPTVLIIEDDEDTAYFNYHSLKGFYEVEIATDGESGFKLWLEKRHDLVLLDFMLPGIKGDKVLVKILEHNKNQAVIVMTGFDDPDRNMDMVLCGACDYLSKPVDIHRLRALCAEVLKRSALIQQASVSTMERKQVSTILEELDESLGANDFDHVQYCIEMLKRSHTRQVMLDPD